MNDDNSAILASFWGNFIDWERRRAGEDGFLVKTLRQYGCTNVFDACLGDGCDSIYLIQQGFSVLSNEIDQSFLEKALENAEHYHTQLFTASHDWRSLPFFLENKFDAVTCTGNSLTYLHTEEDRQATIDSFYRILPTGGVLIIDERNYQYMLDNRDDVLAGNFHYTHQYVYCGSDVLSRPVYITDDNVRMQYYEHSTRKTGYLDLYPFKQGELERLLQSRFKSVERFSDYNKGINPDADFYQYVCVK